MTTGRINQVTIVRRGWPSGALGRRRDCPSYWWAPARWLGAPPAAPSARPWAPLAAIRFPLSAPQGTRPPQQSRCGRCGLGAPGGGPAPAASDMASSAAGGCPRLFGCCFDCWPSASYPQRPAVAWEPEGSPAAPP
ncbi:hypothetical protein N3K66_008934 [Trichothecium roseum]|uniref:Uncharacterized protein n=1 Tax=Trichothecium roseum TaxID=47278 RepID=A0ACC0UR82_9HYPO|nr:hypothetical protein N3K66_008934 [Trichothecium roseum]